jgi:hypothetical protein
MPVMRYQARHKTTCRVFISQPVNVFLASLECKIDSANNKMGLLTHVKSKISLVTQFSIHVPAHISGSGSIDLAPASGVTDMALLDFSCLRVSRFVDDLCFAGDPRPPTLPSPRLVSLQH